MESRRNFVSIWLIVVVILIAAVVVSSVVGGAVGYAIATGLEDGSEAIPAQSAARLAQSIEPASASSPSTTTDIQTLTITEESAGIDAVEKILPAVVTIFTRAGFGGGSGSGFFISEDGYIVTNNHVVEGASDITILYATGGSTTARIVGTAPEFDLAVLQVEGPAPAVAEWGDSGELPLGAGVIAIGSALGEYQNTVTAGVLSGFNRQLAGMNGLLQTDAAINQGNSGGPLINRGGQVIGINTLVARGMGDVQGVGFAISSNIARNVVRTLIETGEAKQPFLGIQYQALNPQLAKETGVDINEGALLESVLSNTPADRAGLRNGDVIVAVEGRSVDDRHPLVGLLLEHVAGDTITLDVLRDGEIFQTQLTLAERA